MRHPIFNIYRYQLCPLQVSCLWQTTFMKCFEIFLWGIFSWSTSNPPSCTENWCEPIFNEFLMKNKCTYSGGHYMAHLVRDFLFWAVESLCFIYSFGLWHFCCSSLFFIFIIFKSSVHRNTNSANSSGYSGWPRMINVMC